MLGKLFLDVCILCADCCICGTFVSILLRLRRERTAAGLSMLTILTVVTARSLHLISHLCGLHYVPSMVPDFIFMLFDVVNASAGLLVVYEFFTKYRHTYEKEKDNFAVHLFQKFDLLPKTGPLAEGPLLSAVFMYSLVAVCALAWYSVRRTRHSFLTSYFCCYYEVLTMVALFPQLWMFHQDKRVSPLLGNFVVLTALNRFFTLLFWASYPRVFLYRYPDNRGVQMASEILNILILSDFIYYWVRSKMRGDKEIIIGDGCSEV
eukprot:TRINITY_DN21917_c0_g1_i1.p1 TRINITY_DN21917_c0_g1~~TRINITY_DN21917_c0_g1_i1.p1  ORF type:complete len:264 (-),score=32.20 TRINITY_DN21917_c0_g1_i1:180-971(-)